MKKKNMKHMNGMKHMNAEKEKPTMEQIVKRINKREEYKRQRKGLYRTKDQIQDVKFRKYVKAENQIRNRNDEPLTNNTEGKKKEYQHAYPTKSQLEWNKERDEREKGIKPEIQYVSEIGKEKYYGNYKRKEYIFIYNREENRIEDYAAEFEEITVKLKKFGFSDREYKRNILVRCDVKNMNGKIKTDFGELTAEEIIKTALMTGIEIYEVIM